MWTLIEDNVSIICACLPTCRPLLARIFPSLFGYSEAGSLGYNSESGRRNHQTNRSNLTGGEAEKTSQLSRMHTRTNSSDDRSDDFVLGATGKRMADQGGIGEFGTMHSRGDASDRV
jgi:hypothetical protein